MDLTLRTRTSFLIRAHNKNSSSSTNPSSASSSGQSHVIPSPTRSNSNTISPARSGSWTATTWNPGQWDPNDHAVRRFSEPAALATKQNLTQHVADARAAYARAFVAIQKASSTLQKSTKNVDVAGLLHNSTEQDVAKAAFSLYAGSAAGEKDGVSRFVDTLHHYHGVFDVLSQADFGYLTIIWGGMKLILIMAKNRNDLFMRLTDMLVDIGLALSRVEVLVKLYPTTRMVELTSRLYAAVLEFLEEIILLFQRSAVRQMFSSLIRPFDEKFGRVLDRIQRVESWIHKDAQVMQAMQTASIAHHQIDSFLQRHHVESALRGIQEGQVPDILLKIKESLFRGFENQADYHESLAATYGVTSRAWCQWFTEEQKYLPSSAAPATRLTHGLCDAPDFQHALQWKAQQKAQSPQIPSAYIIWTPDMTAHSAIASLIFQIIQQRPAVVSQRNFDMNMFARANASITALWNMFVNLMKVLGGCLIYISIGSVGPDEFAVVEKFVKTVRDWDGPPVAVTIIHPFNEGFVQDEDVTDLDGAYDVHPSLCVTDALQHVLMLELDIHEVPQTIRTLLWEAVWRETRYATIGVSFRRLTDLMGEAAETLSRERAEAGTLDDAARDLWLKGVERWMENKVATNNVREQIQRHLDMVDLGLPESIQRTLARHVKLLVFRVDSSHINQLATRALTEAQRGRIWDLIEEAIKPGPTAMFCGTVRETVEEALDSFAELPPSRNPRQAMTNVLRLLDERFGWEGTWKDSILDDEQLIVASILKGIMTGFELVMSALMKEDLSVESQD